MRRRYSAFTLVELLVLMYANDNRGYLPAVPGRTCTIGSTRWPMGWWMLGSGMMDLSDGAAVPYLPPSRSARLEIFSCPNDASDGDYRPIDSATTIGRRNFTYSFNAYVNYNARATPPAYDDHYVINAKNPPHGMNWSSIHVAGSKILICEEKWPNDSCGQLIAINGGQPNSNDVPADRHGGYGNFIFCDGHADRVKPVDFYNNCTHTANPTIKVPAGTAIGVDWWNWTKY